jgi:hypothetical protein
MEGLGGGPGGLRGGPLIHWFPKYEAAGIKPVQIISKPASLLGFSSGRGQGQGLLLLQQY